MPADDFYQPSDPAAQRRENELLALENRFLRARLSQREEEAGSRWLPAQQAKRVDGLEAKLEAAAADSAELQGRVREAEAKSAELENRLGAAESEARRLEQDSRSAQEQIAKLSPALAQLEDEVADLKRRQRDQQSAWAREARGIGRSRSWRLGRGIVRAGRALAFRRPVTPPGGPEELADRISEGKRPAPPRAPREGGEPPQGIAGADLGPEALLGGAAADSTFGRILADIPRGREPDAFSAALQRTARGFEAAKEASQAAGPPPLVSVVMPTFDRAEIIGDAIASVLQQHYGNWELLVCDDGSTDDTKQVVLGVGDERIRYLQLPKAGAAAARNAGLAQARGELIAYLDTDNHWHPGFLAVMVDALLAESGKSAAYSDYIDYRVTTAGRIKLESFERPPFDHERLLEGPYIDLNSFVHRRELYDRFGGFREDLARRQDYALTIKFTWLRDPLHVPCLLTLYQRNERLNQITRQHRHDVSVVEKIDSEVKHYLADGLPAGDARVSKVTIVSWDMSRNHFSKPFALAEALSRDYDVQLISFQFFEDEIFPPLKGVDAPFETVYLPGGPFPGFFGSMAQALASVRGDVIYVVKPRLPSLGLGLLANKEYGIPLMLEINDLETVVASPRSADAHNVTSFDEVDLGEAELASPYSNLWSEVLAGPASDVPVLLTHNHEIDSIMDNRCLYMRNIKDEHVYDPGRYDRDQVRAELGFEPSDRVILFGGMLRRHKGIAELVELLERLDDPRYKLLFAGSRETPDQRELAERHPELRILPPQDREAMARINLAADLVVLWLNPEIPASAYQMPYKATDAFAMNTPVIANDISDLGILGRQGYLRLAPFGDWDAMQRTITELFDQPAETLEMCRAARRLYLRQFSYAAARGAFGLALERIDFSAGADHVLPAARSFASRFESFYLSHGSAPEGEPALAARSSA